MNAVLIIYLIGFLPSWYGGILHEMVKDPTDDIISHIGMGFLIGLIWPMLLIGSIMIAVRGQV